MVLPAPHLLQLYSKIRREIVAKEQAAYEGRQAAGVFKPIERIKLEVGAQRCASADWWMGLSLVSEVAAACASG